MACLNCCWPNNSLDKGDKSNFEGELSPIVRLDDYVKVWAYEKFKEMYEDEACCKCFGNKLRKRTFGRRFPKMKNLQIMIGWDGVEFKSGRPYTKSDESKSNGTEPNVNNPSSSCKGMETAMELQDLKPESFDLTYSNTTDEDATWTFNFEKSVKSSYEVNITKSVQTGHSVKVELKLPDPVGLSAEYEFNKLIENTEGTTESSETETKWTNDCPIKVSAGHTATASFVMKMQNYKRDWIVPGQITGNLYAKMKSKKRIGGKYLVKSIAAVHVGQLFDDLLTKKDIADELEGLITVDEDLVVHYTSNISVSANRVVDQMATIKQERISSSAAAN